MAGPGYKACPVRLAEKAGRIKSGIRLICKHRVTDIGVRPILDAPIELQVHSPSAIPAGKFTLKRQALRKRRMNARSRAIIPDTPLIPVKRRLAKKAPIPSAVIRAVYQCCPRIEARALLLSWARSLGLAVSVDAIGNLFLRREGMDPSAAPVMTGSHMDTQPKGGRFDGIYGVLAGLEALEAMDAAGVRTRAPIEVVAWTNEEGGRFPPCSMGSMVFAGARTVEAFIDVRDHAGIRLGDALAQTLAATPDAARRPAALPAMSQSAMSTADVARVSTPVPRQPR